MSKPVVLVVEDHAAIRRGLFDALRRNGYEARECGRGDEAAVLAMQTPLDLVLLDVMLPGVDGFTLLEDLRRARPRLGVILLTARGAEDDRVRGLKLGADDYVVKRKRRPERSSNLSFVVGAMTRTQNRGSVSAWHWRGAWRGPPEAT